MNEREPEQRRDLAPAQPAPNPMGGELFTVTEKRYVEGFGGRRIEVTQVDRHQAIGAKNG